ncbi:MAG: tetratricopeptide repeat protein, partial [Thermoplasmatales archaeon]|nr:tetratricopeptide repeat protein [Thermoplasmatales archaeon]
NVVFSDKILEYEAAQLSYQAVKEFILGNFDEAIAKMMEAISLDRNHLLYYWNLGRLLMLTDNLSEAKNCYKEAIKLVKISDHNDKEKLEKSLQNEINHFSSKKYGKPIADVM